MISVRDDPFVQVSARAIVSYLGEDPVKVLAFYQNADPRLRGKHPLVDALLDELDDWLIEKRWMPHLEARLHGKIKVVDEQGNARLLDMDAETWGEY